MKMARLNIQLPLPLKAKLDALSAQGYTASGFIRSLLERELNQPAAKRGQKGLRTMTTQQTQKARRQLRTKFKNDFKEFLSTMTPVDIDNIFALAIANRQAAVMREARP